MIEFLDFDESLALYLTGTSHLHHLLCAQGGWRTLHIHTQQYFACIDHWPRLLLQKLTGLRSLRIGVSSVYRPMPMMKLGPQDIFSLSRFLTDLELDFMDWLEDDSIEHLPPSLTRLWLPFNTGISHKGLAHLPKTLLALNLKCNRNVTDANLLPRQLCHYVAHPLALLPCDSTFNGLPPFLERLDIKAPVGIREDADWTVFDISSLKAPLLRHLTLEVTNDISDTSIERERTHIWHFPPQLEVLCLSGTGCSNLVHQSIPSLPQTLTKLKLSFDYAIYLDWSDQDLTHLPRGLKHLEIFPTPRKQGIMHSQTDYVRYRLPGTSLKAALDSRNLFYSGSSSVPVEGLSIECFPIVPRTLHTLRIEVLRAPDGIYRTQRERLYHPIELKLEILPETFDLSMETLLQSLPATITCLWSYIAYREESEEPIQIFALRYALPPLLRSYSGIIPPIHQKVAFNPTTDVVPYESRLENVLYAYENTSFHKPIAAIAWDGNPLTGMTHLKQLKVGWNCPGLIESLFLLRNLTTLDFMYAQITDKDILCLPDGLLSLQINTPPPGMITDQMIPALPHDLLRLSLISTDVLGDVFPFPKKLTSLCLKTYFEKSKSKPRGYIVPLLPPYLVTVSLKSDRLFNDESFLNLPSRLSKFEASNLNGQFFEHMPRSLIEIKVVSGHVFDEHVRCLPRGLKIFQGSETGSELSDRSAADWPRSLSTLTLNIQNLSDKGLKELPREMLIVSLPAARYTTCTQPNEVDDLIGTHWRVARIGIQMELDLAR